MVQKQLQQTIHKLPQKHRVLLATVVASLVVFATQPASDSKPQLETAQVNKRISVPLPIAKTDSIAADTPLPVHNSASVPALAIAAKPKAKPRTDIPQTEFAETSAAAAPKAKGVELELGKRYTLAMPDISSADPGLPLAQEVKWQSLPIRRGDNLAKLFDRQGLTPQEVYRVSKAGKSAKKLLKLRPGDDLAIHTDADGALMAVRYQLSPTDTLFVEKQTNDRFGSRIETREVYSQLNFAGGEITSNFWNAGVKAGMTDNQIMSLAGIFGWDIDFALEIRKGDNFSVIFEENYIDGEFVGFGDIVAAEFQNQGEKYTAIRYTDGNYYTPEGRSMRKSFLRAPVNFKYISSSFKKRRFHPVQKRWKAHNGIDYAADPGTPVIAAGNGRVIKSAYNRFNGHYVFIQHGEKYVTKYLHFRKRAVKTGSYVKQGQVIGYVGSTGLASGPHLHYEFLVNGVHRNPRTVKLPKADPIAKKERSNFQQIAQVYLGHLENNKRIMLAQN